MNFKRSFLTFSVSLCLLFSQISASAQTGIVKADILNIRSSNNTSSDVLHKAHLGDSLEILAGDGEWYKILLENGSEGYVKSEYISVNQSYFGVVTATNLIVRSSTSVYANALSTIPYGTLVELLAYDGNWYKIKYNGTQTGYVSAMYISLDTSLAVVKPYEAFGYVNATALNIRQTTSTSSSVISRVPMGATIKLLTHDGEWYKVLLNDGSEGYAKAEYVSLTPVEAVIPEESVSYDVNTPDVVYTTRPAASVASDETVMQGEAIVQSAYQFLGVPYVWSAAGPTSFDCSGFTMYVMSLHGISLPHQSGKQYDYGCSVEKDALIPGDLVFFSSSSKSTVAHVGIYIGDGNFIHASSGSAKSVTISPLSANYYTKHYLGARRVI